MAKDNDQEFNEEEWKASAADGPSFEFEESEGEPAEAPEFEPKRKEPELDDHTRAWRDAEPVPPAGGGGSDPRDREEFYHTGEARNPVRPSADERQWAAIGHAAGAVSVLVTGGVAGWLVPLIIWIVKKDDGGFAAEQSKEALNFQITAFLLSLIAIPLVCIGVGILILFAIPIASVVFSIIGAVRTYEGERYDYPINFRLI